MNYLVDTHILLWSFVDPKKLSPQVKDILINEENSIYYSQISLWEISLKYSLRKLELKYKTPEYFYTELENSYYVCKLITNTELVGFYKLPIEHKDPFDRLLIWQCIQNKFLFISYDDKLQSYEKYGLKYIS